MNKEFIFFRYLVIALSEERKSSWRFLYISAGINLNMERTVDLYNEERGCELILD